MALRIFRNHFDFASERRIERRQIVRRNPIFAVGFAARLANLILAQELLAHTKASDVALAGCRHVPVPRDLDCVFLAQHRIEDRLFRKPRRERAHTRGADQLKLGRRLGARA